jgi:hypothetical protein
MNWDPVCGWFGPNVQCFAYPCAATYGNVCGASSDVNIAYTTPGMCPCTATDQMVCPDGSFYNRDPALNCEFPECTFKTYLTQDTNTCMLVRFVCPTGSDMFSDSTGCGCRVPYNLVDSQYCSGESPVCAYALNGSATEYADICEASFSREVAYALSNSCNMLMCSQDAELCPDGSYLSRDPQNNCEFPACTFKSYVYLNSDSCAVVRYTCPAYAAEYFSDENGCGW